MQSLQWWDETDVGVDHDKQRWIECGVKMKMKTRGRGDVSVRNK